MRVLVVEDKEPLARHLGRALKSEGYDVALAFNGEQALHMAREGAYQVMLLDVMLPRMDGFTVIRRMRELKLRTQTIMVSARDAMHDIVTGLDAGADDYLTKPYALDVLLAKVRAMARRAPETLPERLQCADLVLLPDRLEMQRGVRTVPLTRTECNLLAVLIRRAGTVVPHAVLLDEGWKEDAEASFDSLYVFIRGLRAKITQHDEEELLHTIRGVGYTLRAESCA